MRRGIMDEGFSPESRLYGQEFFRCAAGSTLRPGGTGLTLRGLRLCGLLAGEGPDACAVRPGLEIVDLGCGSGASLALLADLGFEACGVEPSAAMRAEAAAHVGKRATLLEGRLEALPLANACKDAVLCECVLSLVPDKAAALAEMARVLRPGGSLLLSDLYRRPGASLVGPSDFLKDELRAEQGSSLLKQRTQGQNSSAQPTSCLAGASSLDSLRALLEQAGFRLLAEEDHSRALAELAGQMIFNGAGRELAAWLGASCPGGGRPGRDIGYVLLAAAKMG